MGAPQYEQAGADIAGGGTAGNLAVWTTGSTLGNSGITDNGTTVSFVGRNLASTAAQTWTLASSTSALNIASGLLNLDTTNARVGIGTTSPAFKLEVAAGTASAMRLVSDSGTATVLRLLQTANRDWGIRIPASSTSLSFYDYSAAAERMVIDLNGNVGIGTASPAYRLHIEGTSTNGVLEVARLSNANSGGSATAELGFRTGATDTQRAYVSAGYGPSDYNLSFGTTIAGVKTETMRLTQGNVGIGYTGGVWSSTYTGMFLNRGLSFMARDGGDAYLSANAIYDSSNAWKYVASGTTASTQISLQSGATVFSRAVAGTAGSALTWLESARIDASGRLGIGQSPTTYILETATDASFYGVRVGRGAGAVSTNTVVGSGALNANTTGLQNTAVGVNSLAANVSGQNNTAVGYGAITAATGSSNTAIGAGAATNQTTGTNNTAVGHQAGWACTINSNNVSVGQNCALYQTGANNTAIGAQTMLGVLSSSTGGQNTAVGSTALYALTTGANNTAVGLDAGNNITTGSANICLGRASATAAPTDSNQLVIGSAGQFVATNGGATTWYTTATAQSTGVLPATCGFIRVRLNGTYVKIPVYAD